ncbi:MAG TPA: LPS-assembly protein LptD, partial [Burkholderiaceae bacterium]
DRVAGRARWAIDLNQDGKLGRDTSYTVRSERVSDDDYWRDLPNRVRSQTQRLLPGDFSLTRELNPGWGNAQAYANVATWQVLAGRDVPSRFAAPYQRTPQLGVRWTSDGDDAVLGGFQPWGRKARLEGGLELEYNRFDLPAAALPEQLNTLKGGQRAQMLGHVSLPFGGAGWWTIPRLSLNSAVYDLDQAQLDGRTRMARSIPSFSVDQGWVFERKATLFGRDSLQTLEPRLLYVNTPYRSQLNLPNFDSAPKDFNFDSIYTDNQFTGIDRVSDADQLTAGVTTRWLDTLQGGELLRLGVAQRFLFRNQQVTPDGVALTKRSSDLLLLGSAHLTSQWWTDASLQYDPQTRHSERSVVSARYAPGPFRTVSLAYRATRGQSEQVELNWQWPLFGAAARQPAGASKGPAGSCSGTWYSAGRLQYSLFDKRFVDSVVGVEYDAGCWIMRVGVERLSTGLAQTNTRLLLQLELVGLSRLGSNALKVLRDNIPGYRPLSADRSASSDASYD